MAKKLKHPADRLKEASLKGPAARHIAPPVGSGYNPENWPSWMTDLSETTINSKEAGRRMSVSAKLLKEGKVKIHGRMAILKRYESGRLVEAYRGRKGWNVRLKSTQETDRHVAKTGTVWAVEMKYVNGADDFRALTESSEWVTAKIMESQGVDGFDLGDDFGLGGGISGPPNNEFIPLLGGPFSKQLYLTDYLEMMAKCFWAKNHHPLAKAIIRTLRNYVIGKGVKLMFKNADCQKVWDEFEKRAKFHNKLRSDFETLIWAGEIMTEKTTDREGRPTMKQVDPSTVWEIVTEPTDIEQVFYYHQQYPTQWQLIYKAGDKTTEYIINDIPADKIIHIKDNVTPGEKRGRSELFPVLSWLKRYRDYLNAKTVKAQTEESWALDISVDGNQGDVERIASDNTINRIPPAGATRVHNKDVEYKYLQPTSSSTTGRDNVAEQLRVTIAVGAGLSPDWLGEDSASASRATAFVKQSPATRNVEDKQRFIEDYLRQIAQHVLDTNKVLKTLPETQMRGASFGMMKQALSKRDIKALIVEGTALLTMGPVTEPLDESFECIFPEISSEDRTAKIGDIMKAEVAKYISHERAAVMVAKELAITAYDFDSEQEAMQTEADLGIGAEWSKAALNDQGGGTKGGAASDELAGAAGGDDEQDDEPGAAAAGKGAKSAQKKAGQ